MIAADATSTSSIGRITGPWALFLAHPSESIENGPYVKSYVYVCLCVRVWRVDLFRLLPA